MREEVRQKRQQDIESAAYRLIEANGYGGMSMLAVAKAARASNETLYKWYGDKLGLFAAMVKTNAAAIADELSAVIAAASEPIEGLAAFAPKLLAVLTGDRAVALNRAAAADPSGELGRAIAFHGRETIAPRLQQLMEKAIDNGEIMPSASQATEWYIRLVVGDIQVRRVIGAMAQPSPEELARRAAEGFAAFRQLTRPR